MNTAPDRSGNNVIFHRQSERKRIESGFCSTNSNMRRNLLHIALLLSLALYYNGAGVLWFSYSTFAKDLFANQCENPTKPCCQGKCQVEKAADKSNSSEQSSTRIQTASAQPSIVSTFVFSAPPRKSHTYNSQEQSEPISGISESPFHPPRG